MSAPIVLVTGGTSGIGGNGRFVCCDIRDGSVR